MAQVPVRQPRFLGEKVPYRDQSMQESIQQELGSGYTVESFNGGYVAKAKPVQYVAERRGADRKFATYIPSEIFISPEGKVLKETSRGVYKEDVFEHGQRQAVYDREVTDYQAQTRFTFGKRDLKSGRETIRQTSSNVGGVYKEKRIIDQDSKEYEMAKAEHELFSTFVGRGRSYAESRILSRMTEQQREARFKAEAKEKSARFSVQGKSITAQHQAQRDFESQYKADAQKYAMDIVAKQEAGRKPVVESPKPVTAAPSVFYPENPASPTTRTDMGTPFILTQKKQPGGTISTVQPMAKDNIISDEKYGQQRQLESDNIVQKQIDKLRFGYAEQTKQLDFHPVVTDIIVPFSVGATNIILGTAAHPIEAGKSLLHPVELAKNVRSELAGLTATKGEVYSLSYLGGTVAGAEVLGRGQKKTFEFAKDVYVKAGSKKLPSERVFSSEVLEGKKTFPTTKSTAESLASFNKGGKTVDVQVAEAIVKNPEVYAKPPVKGTVLINNPVLRDIKASVKPGEVVYTGGVARRVLTGEGRIRDVDVITATPKESAYSVAKKFPDKYEIIQHEKYPEIYRLREKKTGKVVADFDPIPLAEEGLINPKAVTQVGEYRVVKPEVLLKSKATQIIKGKSNPKYPLKQAENIQQLSPGTPILKDQVIVSTVSPAKLKGLEVTGKVEKVGLEDPGIYVSPKGEASAYFTGIAPESVTYSLNPFKGMFGVPTVTEFSIRGVRTYPQSVLIKPGFAHLESFQRSQAGQGYAYITKRSQIGTGDIPRQRFELLEETTMTGETVKPGSRFEAGTVEKEAVIGVGESYSYTPKSFFGKVKGFDFYTEYKGRAVAVREAKLLTTTDVVSPESITIPGGKVQAGVEAFGLVASESKVVSPSASLKGVPFGTLKPVGSSSQKSYSKPPTVAISQIVPGESSKTVASQKSSIVSSKVSQISPGQSVASSFKSDKSSLTSPVSSPVSSVRGSSIISESSGGLSSGRSFGGSSSGKSGGSSGGGSSGGGSSGGGSSGRPSEGIPLEYPKPYSRPREQKERKDQYKVEVRKRGIFKTIAVTETPEEAFRIGKFNVEQTASASLRVKPVGSSAKVTGVGKGILPFTKFRESKKEPDVFIQMRKFRIGTPGEKKEITFRGLQVQRSKRARKGFGIFG